MYKIGAIVASPSYLKAKPRPMKDKQLALHYKGGESQSQDLNLTSLTLCVYPRMWAKLFIGLWGGNTRAYTDFI